jgi:transcriptional activator SPT7
LSTSDRLTGISQRPALGDHVGPDGAGAFNDGSDQFASGDFAEEMDEDFFGFRELGLADELGLTNLSVPFHLLQNRISNHSQNAGAGPINSNGLVFPHPEPYEGVSMESLGAQIGLVQDYFRGKLRGAGSDESLVEDEDLPQKQRFPKPRLPPTGKISSPRKRPIREQQQAAKKKRKMEEVEKSGGGGATGQPPLSKLRLDVPKENGIVEEPSKGLGSGKEKEKDGEDVVMGNGDASGEAEDGGRSMISPESLNAS